MPKPGEQELSDQMMSTKSLSSGERSYSTSCFILSLWDVMDSPFHILDEFDIFMASIINNINAWLSSSSSSSSSSIEHL